MLLSSQTHSATSDGAPLRRNSALDSAAINRDERTVNVVFSTETPIPRRNYWGDRFNEVLSHAPGSVDLTRLAGGATVLFNHDASDYIGTVVRVEISKDKRGLATLRLNANERGEEIWQDILSGALRFASVGYQIDETTVSEGDKETVTATRWTPYEISIVTVPADANAGIGRSASERLFPQRAISAQNGANAPVHNAATSPANHTRKMNREKLIQFLQQRGIAFATDATDADIAALAAGAVGEDVANAQTRAQANSAIRKLAEQYAGTVPNAADLALRAIADGKGVTDFQSELLAALHARNATQVRENASIGIDPKEAKQFRFCRLLSHLADPSNTRAKNEAGFELEIIRAAQDKGMGRRGLPIPYEMISAPIAARRDLISAGSGTGLAGTGSELIATTRLFGSFIELLENSSAIIPYTKKFNDLVGNVDITKESSAPSVYWIGENESTTPSAATFSSLSIEPHTVAALVGITRKMLNQPSMSIETYVRQRIAEKSAIAIDAAALYGTGAANQPTGLANTAGLNSVTFAAANPTFSELVQMETELANDNALVGSRLYVARESFRGYAKTTLKFSGISGTIWEPGDTVNGYAASLSNQVQSGEIFFGNFNDLLFAHWAGMEILTERDVSTGSLTAAIYQDVDFKVLRPESFTKGVGTVAP